MKPVWQPLIPIRWNKRHGEVAVLQQAWGKRVFNGEEWVQTTEYEWRDVPYDIEDAGYWCKEEEK